ncbi:MAG TPA: phosphoribosyltransferase family protein [Alphaproteobacteria bacterium]|nr:phosphoribosyltransferase family protein [Alphaproteobacteria bacterium]
MKLFSDRAQAGHLLSQLLEDYADRDDVVVMGVTPSGVVVGYEIAQALNLKLEDAFPVTMHASGVTKIELPNGEVGFYADSQSVKLANLARASKGFLMSAENLRDLTDHTVILVDDCMITGDTMKAAIESLEANGCQNIVVAVPVASETAVDAILPFVNEVHSLFAASTLEKPDQLYENYPDITPLECGVLLSGSRQSDGLQKM